MEKTKIVLIDAEDAIENYKRAFSAEEDVEIVGAFSSGAEAITNATKLTPNLIILDLLIPECDGFEVITELKEKLPNAKFIVASNLNSAVFVTKAIELGVDYFMMKPVDEANLVKRAKEVANKKSNKVSVVNKQLEEKITNIFLTVGIPAHIKGYQFLREAIKMAVDDPHIINSITKKLYPGIAEIYSTTASKVERAIRHAIEVAWNKGKIENINDVFGLHVYDTHEKPTNGEFIALVADKMLLEKF